MASQKGSVDAFLKSRLDERRNKHHFQSLKVVDNLIDLASNDYLGFARDIQLVEQIKAEWEKIQKVGSTGSRLLTGNHAYFEKLEDTISQFHKAESGLIFNSGYMANFGLFSTLLQPDHTFIYDLHIHASVHDGAKISKAHCYPLRHNDLNHLENRLRNARGTIFVAVESIYSTDGSIAPLREIVDLCEKYHAHLVVDEAHATGVVGERGEGIVSKYGLESRVFARLHTFSKALGVEGAIVLGSDLLKKYLINFTRPFMYTTALSYHSLAAIKCAYELLEMSFDRRNRLHGIIQEFHQQASGTKIPFLLNNTPIQILTVPGNEDVEKVSQMLLKTGMDVRAITSPTVRRGQECLRISLHAFNTREEISLLMKHLNTIYC